MPNRDLFTPPPKGYWNITAEYGTYNVVDALLTFTKRSEQMVDGMKIISLSGFGPRAGADNLLPMLSIELDQAETTAALLAMGATGFVSKKLPALGLLSTQVNRSKGNGHALRVQRHLPPEDNNGISFHVSFQCFFK